MNRAGESAATGGVNLGADDGDEIRLVGVSGIGIECAGGGVRAMRAIVEEGDGRGEECPGLNSREIRSGGTRAGLPERGAPGETLADPTVPIDGAVELLHVLAGLVGRRVTDASAGHIAVIAIEPSIGAGAHAIEQVAKHRHDSPPR